MKCAEVREILPAHPKDGEISLAARRHVAGCPHCKVEIARYESLRRSLAGLESEVAIPSAALFDSLVAIPQGGRWSSVTGHVARNRKAYLGGAAFAAAGTAGALVWLSRRRFVTT